MKKISRLLSVWLVICMLAGVVSSTVVATSAEDQALIYTGPNITAHEGGYDTHVRTLVTHAYDFSIPRISYYAVDSAVAMDNRAAGMVENGVLTTKEGMSMSFGSAVCLGDDYGLEDGYLTFDLCRKEGTVTLGVRTSRTACATDERGVWFVFDGSDKMKIYEPISGLEAAVDFSYELTEVKTFTLHEGLDTITLSCGEEIIASVKYTSEGYLAFCDKTGKIAAETYDSDLYVTGYFQLSMEDLDGYIDNVVFTNVEVDQSNPTSNELRTIDYATWTATDDLDRAVADTEVAGAPKENRYVGLFYFLCWVGAGGTVQDNTKLYVEGGMESVWNLFNSGKGGEAYWAEPYFGYYRNTDTWVYRKHAYMLEQAGVDFIYLDVSNAEVFVSGHMALFDTFLQMRNEGIDTPQIVFFNGDTPATFQSNMKTLFTTVYSDENWEKYEELFFMWDGKPLIFGNYSGLSGEIKQKVDEKFTVRGSWAWVDQNNYWSWIQEYYVKGNSARPANGGWGRNAEGKYESLSVALGHHATTSKGRSFVNGKQPNNGLGDFEYSSIERAGLGLCFESQFKAVMNLVEQNVPAEDPFVLMITGWNEWIAGCTYLDQSQTFCGGQADFLYVDNFNAEFSRDAEPMRNADGYGFGDNYYYQMVDYIRKYKGIAKTTIADDQGTVSIYDLSTWESIDMTYMDSLYDVELRNTVSYDAKNRYINNTGRNDFDYAKVSQDGNNLYLLVKCARDIIIDDGETWMNLYLNTDGDTATGWEGYDYVLNRDRDSFVVTVEKFKDDTFETETVGGAYYALNGAYMTVRLSKDLVGLEGLCDKLIFKWADNSVCNGDPMAFMDLGDTAPDNRFGFLYLCEDYTTSAEAEVVLARDAAKTTVNGSSVSGAADGWQITVKSHEVDMVFDMNGEQGGQYIDDTALTEHFEMVGGTSNSRGWYQKLAEGNNIAHMSGFCDLRTWNDVEGAYTFSMDIRMGDEYSNSIYVRGEMPGALTPENPANFGVAQVFNYYEWDWYRENGGSKMGGSSTAGSGIGILPGQSGVTVVIKRYAPDGLTVASASVMLAYPDGFSVPSDGWVKFTCVDDEEAARFYFDDRLLCTVRMENPGVTYESDGTGQKYYGLCTVVAPNGKEMLRVENTRVNAQGSQLALTTRNVTMEFDNIHIAFDELVAEGDRVEEVLSAQDTVSYTPDTFLLSTLNLGTAQVKPEIAETQTVDSAQSVSEESSAESDCGMSDDDGGCRSVMSLAAVPATLLCVILLVAIRKKKD